MLKTAILSVALMIGFNHDFRHMVVYVDEWPAEGMKAEVCREVPDWMAQARTVEVMLAIPHGDGSFHFETVAELSPWECVDGIRYEKRDPDSNPGYVRPADPDHGRGSQ